FDNDGEDLWRFAGWNWSQDFWCEGDGTPVAFIDLDTVTAPDPSADALRAENEALKAERDRYKPEPHPHEDMWSVVYRPGPPTVEDYDEAITALRNAQTALTYGDSMGCRVCEDSGHSAAYCHHNPLLLARKWAAASRFWQCWHCGFVARNDEEGRAHFGQHDGEGPACLDALRAENERLKHIANEWADTATSGLQWLRNIRDGISTVEDALSNMDACLEHCQETARQSLGGRDG
ncbi:hypothetical protein, partial [Phenylobacterium sp. SCN 70-31]|uniref:hypothetical protein n=1 Tax=Phenylobacterium sp. SCN 70-31 TaxID=1660129 RepID=UPI0025D5307E